MKRRYSYRAYPTTRQQRDLARLFGCVHRVYNDAVAVHSANFEAGLPQMGASEVQTFVVTEGRRLHPWLADVSSVALVQSVRDAQSAFTNFFASRTGKRRGQQVGYPRFKSRFSGKRSARFTSNGFRLKQDRVFLAKIGWVRFALSRALPSAPSSVTVTQRSDTSYEVSFVVETTPADIVPTGHRHAALDMGLASFAAVTYSDGTREKIANPRFYRKQHRKLRKAQRALSRKQGPDKRTHRKASNGWTKQHAKVSRLYAEVAHARTDFARKLACRLASENATIAVEGLNIRGLARSGSRNVQGRGLRRSIHDAAWGEFFRCLTEKAGDRLTTVNPAYTSQTCSICGTPGGRKTLDIRQWKCTACGTNLDRDWNAAVNIMLAAGHAESLNAGGGNVRLQLAAADPRETGTHWSDTEVTA